MPVAGDNGTTTDRVAVIIPAKDEAETVTRVVLDARVHWANVILIDDGSRDATADLARASGARVLRHQTSLGYGAALRTGLTEAVAVGAELVVFLDADGAHDPHESPALVREHYRAQADLTIGTRFHPGLNEWFPTPKRDANLLGRFIFNAAHGTDINDVASGFRVLGPKLIRRGISNPDFGAAFEVLAWTLQSGLVVTEAPITVRYNAAEPCCTGRGELQSFINVCSKSASSPIQGGLQAMQEAIAEASSCAIQFQSECFHLHYLPNFDAYLIQRQNPWFERLRYPTDLTGTPYHVISLNY